MQIKNKKGFLLGEFTLKIIIAVLCITLLIYLLIGIYSLFKQDNQLNQAKNTLERLKTEISSLDSNDEIKEKSFLLTQPQAWVLIYYPTGLPDLCEAKKCLCICEKASYISSTLSLTDQLSQCNKKAWCEKITEEISLNEEIEIKTINLLLKKQDKTILISKE